LQKPDEAMDSRSFLMTGAWLSAAGGTLPWIAHVGAARHTIALVDASLAGGRAFSREVTRQGISVFEINHESGDDIGTLWYTTLAPRLASTRGLVIGVARASDYFVLGELARCSTKLVEQRCERCAEPCAPVAFLLGSGAMRSRSR
jgi:hypothetical protein